jgi:uncharacterized membrane protein YbhN (UPF0104 family)
MLLDMSATQDDVTNASAPDALAPNGVRRRLITTAVLGAAVLTALLAVPSLRPVVRAVAHLDGWWLALAVALEVASCVSFVVVFRMFFDQVPVVPAHELAWTEMASGAVLPGGGIGSLAVGGWLLHQAGVSTRQIVVRSSGLFFYTSATSVAALVGGACLLLTGASSGHRGVLLTWLPLAAGVLVTLVAASVPILVARRPARSRRGVLLRDAAAGITEAERFISHPTWRALGAVGYLGFDIAVLWATLNAAGYRPAIAPLLLGYIIGYLANILPVPGGVGVLEGGLVGTLILYGAPATPAAAGVLIYHAIAFWVPTSGGLPAYALLRKRMQRQLGRATADRSRSGERDAEQSLELGDRPLGAHVVDRRHAEGGRRLEVEREVVDVDGRGRRDAGALGAEGVHRRGRLAHPFLAGDDDAVEQPVQQRAIVMPGAPGVRDQPGPESGRADLRDGGHHRVVGLNLREQPVDQVGRIDPERGAQFPLERLRREAAGLEPDQQLPVGPVGRKPRAEPAALESVVHAEGVERGEQIGRQHAAPVDQEAAVCERPFRRCVDGAHRARGYRSHRDF